MQVHKLNGTPLVPRVEHNANKPLSTSIKYNTIPQGDFTQKTISRNVENSAQFVQAYANFKGVTPQMIQQSFETQYNLDPDDIIEGYG